MAYQGTGYFGGIRFNDQDAADAYKAGQGEYQTVYNVDPNQPYWGQYVPQGYELVGFRQGSTTGMPFAQQPRQTTLRGQAAPDLGPSYAILKRTGSGAPAPAVDDAPSPGEQMQIVQPTEQSEAYRKQSEEQLAAANATIANLSNEELQRQRAAELQNRLAIQAAASQARGMEAARLKIATAAPQTAGTQAFKRRRDQVTMAPIQSTAGINVPTGSVLNI
jgi:hypothetical protein